MLNISRICSSARTVLSTVNLPHRAASSGNVGRQAKILRKLITGKSSSKRAWYPERAAKTIAPTSLASLHKQNKSASRRVNILNKLFMTNITDIMATGELSDLIVGHGIEITRVKICQNFRGLNVFWTADGPQTDERIEDKLVRLAGPLRHELSQLRLMGEVPKITFIKDRHYSMMSEVDAILAKADFGDDYEPVHSGKKFDDFAPAYRTTPVEKDLVDSTLLPMRHDVMGLDHGSIMDRIKGSMSKTKSAWEMYDRRGADSDYTPEETPMTLESVSQRASEEAAKREEILRQFLEKRKIERKNRANKDFDDRQYYAHDLEQANDQYNEDIDVDWEDEDAWNDHDLGKHNRWEKD